jgi:hypothetical protein
MESVGLFVEWSRSFGIMIKLLVFLLWFALGWWVLWGKTNPFQKQAPAAAPTVKIDVGTNPGTVIGQQYNYNTDPGLSNQIESLRDQLTDFPSRNREELKTIFNDGYYVFGIERDTLILPKGSSQKTGGPLQVDWNGVQVIPGKGILFGRVTCYNRTLANVAILEETRKAEDGSYGLIAVDDFELRAKKYPSGTNEIIALGIRKSR